MRGVIARITNTVRDSLSHVALYCMDFKIVVLLLGVSIVSVIG